MLDTILHEAPRAANARGQEPPTILVVEGEASWVLDIEHAERVLTALAGIELARHASAAARHRLRRVVVTVMTDIVRVDVFEAMPMTRGGDA